MNHNNRIAYLALGGALLIIITLSLRWFFTHFEQVESEHRGTYSNAARRNPFLAAERFLHATGAEVESISGRDKLLRLPSSHDVIVVNNFSVNMTSERQNALLTWLHAGGHLILTAGSDDRLLDHFGIKCIIAEELIAKEKAEPISIIFSGHEQPLSVHFNPNFTISSEHEQLIVAVGSEDGSHLMQFEVGEGLLTVMSDNAFLKNPHIGAHDHALYLWLLSGAAERKVWLLYSSVMPSLFTLSWQLAPYAIISLAVLLLLLFWFLFRRFGPMYSEQRQNRRDILEHLDAGAHYLWRLDKGHTLLRTTQHALTQAWLRKYPNLEQTNENQRAEWIALRTQFPVKRIAQALYRESGKEKDFIEATYLLQKIYKPY